MAKTKAELERDWRRHSELMVEVRHLHKAGDFARAIEIAVSAWDHVDGMMQFERRYSGQAEQKSIDSIDFVLRYAPLIFDYERLDALAALLKAQRRIDKNTTADIAADVEKARSLMWDAHRLWGHLERNGQVRQDRLRSDLGGDQDQWRSIAETWEEMGVIRRSSQGGSYAIAFATRMDERARGKCPSCGAVGSGTKARLIEPIICPQCKANVLFVLLGNPQAEQ